MTETTEERTFKVKAGKVTRHFQQLDIEDALRRNPAFKEIPEEQPTVSPDRTPHWKTQLRDNGRFSSKESQKRTKAKIKATTKSLRQDVQHERRSRDWRDDIGELIFVCGAFVLFLWIVAGGIGGTAAIVSALNFWQRLGQ